MHPTNYLTHPNEHLRHAGLGACLADSQHSLLIDHPVDFLPQLVGDLRLLGLQQLHSTAQHGIHEHGKSRGDCVAGFAVLWFGAKEEEKGSQYNLQTLSLHMLQM